MEALLVEAFEEELELSMPWLQACWSVPKVWLYCAAAGSLASSEAPSSATATGVARARRVRDGR